MVASNLVERPLFVYDAGPFEAEAALSRLVRELPRMPAGSLLFLSGFVLDRLENALAEGIAERVEREELELLGGGLYSPYLPLLPERDAAWQLSDMADRLEERFGVEVRGAWLGDAFDLTLIPILAEEGYTFALLPEAALAAPAYAALEEEGVWLFPYAKGRVRTGPKDPRAPFPAGFFPGGGHPRLLPRKRPEAADLFAKMRWVSDKLEEAKRPPEEAYQRLYRGQWGPAYRGEPKAVAYAWRELLAAENRCDPRKYAWLELYLEDMDADGFAEAILESHTLNLYLRPAEGGALFAFDVRELELPLLGGRSMVPRIAVDPEALGDGWHELRFEATKYRDRVHLAASHRGFALKATYRPRPKEEALELEWRIGREDGGAFSGYFALNLALKDPPAPLPEGPAEQYRLALGALSLVLESPRPFSLERRGEDLLLVFPTEIPPGKTRRHRLLLRVER